MASLTKDINRKTKKPNGCRTLQFVDRHGTRKSVRLGKTSQRNAEAIKLRIEALNEAAVAETSLDNETATWVRKLVPKLHDKLERAGLVDGACGSRPTGSPLTLGELIDTYKSRPKWKALKSKTKRNKSLSLRYLTTHFGVDRSMETITVADAGDYYAALRLSKAEGGFELAIATANLASSEAATLAGFAIDAELLDRNPFKTLPRSSRKGDNTMIEASLSREVLDAMRGTQGRLLFALARWGGLRTPSEPTLLRWCDIDWERDRFLVTSPKTAAYEGHETRQVPIFPELAPLLAERFEDASEGDEYVLPILQGYSTSYASNMLRATLRGLGVEPWNRLWHSLRATCQTELEEVFPTHVVCAWLGNSVAVAHKHYLQVTEEHFAKALHRARQQAPAQHGMKGKTTSRR